MGLNRVSGIAVMLQYSCPVGAACDWFLAPFEAQAIPDWLNCRVRELGRSGTDVEELGNCLTYVRRAMHV